MSATHRLQQGVRSLVAFAQGIDHQIVQDTLDLNQRDLFYQMRHVEQLHTIRVLKDIQRQAQATPHDLAVAALLHDVGKSRYPFSLWQRTLAVLLRRFLPGVYHRWSAGNPANRLKRGPIIAAHHAAWSADLVAQTDATERALWLIRHHADDLDQHIGHSHYHLLARLKQADDAN
jgi:hypothetical protein